MRCRNVRIRPKVTGGTLGDADFRKLPMKMMYRKLSKTASLPVTRPCSLQPQALGGWAIVRIPDRRNFSALSSRVKFKHIYRLTLGAGPHNSTHIDNLD